MRRIKIFRGMKSVSTNELCLFLFLTLVPLVTVIKELMPWFSGTTIPEGIMGSIRFLIIIPLVIKNIKKISRYTYFFAFALIFAYLMSAFNTSNFDEIKGMVFTGPYLIDVAMCLYFAEIEVPSKILATIQKASYVIIISNIILMLMGGFDNWASGGYMTFGYSIILYWLFIAQKAFKEKKTFDLLFIIVSGAYILLFANRASTVTMFAAILIYSWVYWNSLYKTMLTFALCSAVVTIQLTSNQIFLTLSNIAGSLGIYSRTFNNSLLLNDFFYVGGNSGRDYIWSSCITMISERPLFGWGIGADRAVIGDWSHNLFLELMVNYGVIIGSILIIAILAMGIYMIFKCEDESWRNLFIPYYITSIVILSVSQSIYTTGWFGVALVVFFAYLSNKKKSSRRHKQYMSKYIMSSCIDLECDSKA